MFREFHRADSHLESLTLLFHCSSEGSEIWNYSRHVELMYISMEVAVISEVPNDTGIVWLAKKFQIEKN